MAEAVPTAFGVEQLTDWATRGEVLLQAARHDIDVLNVFPVPDGDTGTNLLLTWQAGLDALQAAAAAGPPDAHRELSLGRASVAWSRGALLGARGNSGVIVAQLLRAFAETFSGSPTDDAGSPPGIEAGRVMAAAMSRAAELGYAGVARPVEATILTVAAAAARAANDQVSGGLAAVVGAAADGAADALARTPEQLPVLAAAGVVDAGGQGLFLILEALRGAVDPAAPSSAQVLTGFGLGLVAPSENAFSSAGVHVAPPTCPGDGAFEVMYLLETGDEPASRVRERLAELGASVVVVGGDGLWNVHVHTDDAGPAVEVGVAAGRVHRIRITPLVAASQPGAIKPGANQERVVVAVAAGLGLGALFESVGAVVVVGGAQHRPTSAALVEAAGPAGEVLLLPNDDDHRAVAEAAAVELRDRGAQVAVLPTHADVQGLAALAVRGVDRSFTDDVVAMSAAAAATRFGGLAVAEREAMTSAGVCHPGQLLGVVEADIVVLGDSAEDVACSVVDRMLAAGGELVTLVCGDDPLPGRPLAEAVRRHLHQTRLDVEVAVYDGGQPHYPLLIGVE
ncbi:MAG: DAK2 domain-containing protein [Actinomycetia bacterium]|nr:DAK2 domain-containing protein [Actinomycetes bacterium]